MTSSFKTGSLCSGYGGLDLAVREVYPDAEVQWFSEIDPAACAVFSTRFPTSEWLGDIREVDWDRVESVDIITAGYPCQPFSDAGKRGDYTQDDRHLWPYVYEAVRVLRPRIIVLENVPGHRRRGFGEVLGDLATIGYDATWTSLRASDVKAPHPRERVFVFAEDADRQSSDERRQSAAA